MKYDVRKVAGTLLLFGSVQFFLLLVIAEALYPGYSVSENYISNLGVGPTSLIFNSSVFLLGVVAVISAYFVHRAFRFTLFSVFLILIGAGAMGVGLFTENSGDIHFAASLITYIFGELAAVASYKLQPPPLSYFSVFLGVMSFVALVLFTSGTYLGLGVGGMQRLVAYPVLLWAVTFGSFLLSSSDHF